MRYNLSLFVLMLMVFNNVSGQTSLPANINCNTTLTAANSPYLAPDGLNVSPGCYLKINPGVELKMGTNTSIIVQGKIEVLGTSSDPVRIHGNNTKWRLILIDSTNQIAVFNYLIIEDATHGPNGNNFKYFTDVAAITGYYSTLKLDHVTFKNNMLSVHQEYGGIHVNNCLFDASNAGEKIHVMYTSNALIENSTFNYTSDKGDHIDLDGVNNAIIRNNLFNTGSSDAIDIGQWNGLGCNNITIEKNIITNMDDKGVSCGEASQNIHIKFNVIVGCDVAIGSKDGSYAIVDHNTLYANRVGIRSYERLTVYGPARADVSNTIIANSTDSAYFINASSTISFKYSLSNTDALPGTGNINSNPMFSSVQNNQFPLASASPAINAGDPSYAKDPDGTITEIGAFYFNPAATALTEITNKNHLNIYSNPANDFITIQWNGESRTNSEVVVIDVTGKIIFSELIELVPDNNKQVNLSPMKTGIYFIQVNVEGKITQSRILHY